MVREIDTPGRNCSISPRRDQEKRMLPLKRERSDGVELGRWPSSGDAAIDDEICALEAEEEELIQEIKTLRVQADQMERQVKAATAQLKRLNSLVELLLLHRWSSPTLPHSPSKKSQGDEFIG
ncbi:hypothetical protein FI667_g8335, partial [Globisporangium splendens]